MNHSQDVHPHTPAHPPIPPSDHHSEHHHSHEHDHAHDHDSTSEESFVWWRPTVSAILLIAGLILTYSDVSWFHPTWVRALWYLLAFLPVGLGVIREAIAEVREHADWFSEFMLMSVAAIGAFSIGEYPEAVAVMLLYCVGEALQDKAIDRARTNIRSLMALRPDHAWLVTDGQPLQQCKPDDVDVNQIIEVRAGERVPLDGLLLSAEADFDTAALTGESMPRTILANHEVLAGMIPLNLTIRLRVLRAAGQSAVARILHMVEEASERKASTELFIRRFAHVYTPAAFSLAVLVLIVPWIAAQFGIGSEYLFTQWLQRALVFLVISCPCALVISVPLSYYAGIGAASRRGILFKGGNTIDRMIDLDTVAFDKTGTLTTGRFSVRQVEGLSATDLSIVARMEQQSSHPIAAAVVAYVGQQHTDTHSLANVETVSGYGMKWQDWLVGNARLLDQHHVDVPDHLRHTDETLVLVAHENRYLGSIHLADTLKADAHEAIRSLHRHTVILSGDHQSLVQHVAQELGADEAYGNLLPQDKAAHITDLQRRGHKVAFVGDGINDAPVLALSDVGIAMGAAGADMAVETADVVLAGDAPSKVAEAIRIATHTRKIATQNIVFAIGIKVTFMLLAILGCANIWMAMLADTGVTLLAVLNSMRILYVKPIFSSPHRAKS